MVTGTHLCVLAKEHQYWILLIFLGCTCEMSHKLNYLKHAAHVTNIHKFSFFLITKSRSSLKNQPDVTKRCLLYRVSEHDSFITSLPASAESSGEICRAKRHEIKETSCRSECSRQFASSRQNTPLSHALPNSFSFILSS
jgi:hypothetical protein